MGTIVSIVFDGDMKDDEAEEILGAVEAALVEQEVEDVTIVGGYNVLGSDEDTDADDDEGDDESEDEDEEESDDDDEGDGEDEEGDFYSEDDLKAMSVPELREIIAEYDIEDEDEIPTGRAKQPYVDYVLELQGDEEGEEEGDEEEGDEEEAEAYTKAELAEMDDDDLKAIIRDDFGMSVPRTAKGAKLVKIILDAQEEE